MVARWRVVDGVEFVLLHVIRIGRVVRVRNRRFGTWKGAAVWEKVRNGWIKRSSFH